MTANEPYMSVFSRIATKSPAGPGRLLQLHCIVWLATWAAPSLICQTPPASSGTEFYTTLPFLGLAEDAEFRLTISSPGIADVAVTFTETGATISRTVQSGDGWELVFGRDSVGLEKQQEGRSRRSIHITATAPVTVTATHDAEYFSESWPVLPIEGLGLDYRVSSVAGPESNTFGGVVAAVATEDNTTLRITPTVTTGSGNSPGFTYGVTLNRGEVWQIVPSTTGGTDMSGTRLRGDKPIAVVGGHAGAVVTEADATNPIVEAFLPVHRWGKEFYGVPFPERDSGIYSVVAAEDGTSVFVNGALLTRLNAAQSLRFSERLPARIVSDGPVQVAQFASHRPADSAAQDADPAMTLLQPTSAWSASYLWTTPGLPPSPRPGDSTGNAAIPFAHFLIVTAEPTGSSPILLDGVDISSIPAIPYADGRHVAGIVPIDSGRHTLVAKRPIAAQLVGYGHFDAYALPAGYNVPPPLELDSAAGETCEQLLDMALLIRNFRFDTVRILNVDVEGVTASLTAPGLPIALLPYSRQEFHLRFGPLAPGDNPGRAIVRLDNGDSVVAPVMIRRSRAAASVVESVVSFPDASNADPVRTAVAHLINTGDDTLTIREPGGIAPFEILSPPFPLVLAPGDSVEVTIRFAPSGPGTYERTLEFDTEPCDVEVGTTLRGRRTDPAGIEIELSGEPYLLCSDRLADTVEATIRNTGGEPLDLGPVDLTGRNAGDFHPIENLSGRTIPPGDSLKLRVEFIPADTGIRVATMKFNHSLPPGFTLIDIQGRKDSAGIEASVAALDFGRRLRCRGEATQRISVRNSGTVPVALDSIRLALGMRFSTGEKDNLDIPPGDSIEIDLKFEPDASGVFRDTLRAFGSPCDLNLSVPLSGIGIVPSIRVGTDTIDFGILPDCELPDTLGVRLYNDGEVADTIVESLAIGGPFALIGSDNPVLEPGKESVIRVVFQPSDTGTQSATLIVRTEPCGLERTVFLTGGSARPSVTISGATIGLTGIVPGVSSTGSAFVRNSGAVPIRLESVSLEGAPSGISVISPHMPIEIPPGDSVLITFQYRSAAPEPFAFGATLQFSPCITEATIAVTGSLGLPRFRLVLPDTSAPVNATPDLPIRLIPDGPFADSIDLTATIRWNFKNLLVLNVQTADGSEFDVLADSIAGNDRVWVFHYHGGIPADNVIGRVRGLVLLGHVDTTSLSATLFDASVGDGTAVPDVDVVDGMLRTLGICTIGGRRFILLPGEVRAGRPRPNPAGDLCTIPYQTTEAGPMKLILFDASGSIVGTVERSVRTGGSGELQVDLSGLPSGRYGFILSVGRSSAEGTIVIRR